MTSNEQQNEYHGPNHSLPVHTLTEEQCSALKLRINELIWMYAPPYLTLRHADERADKVLSLIVKG